MAQQFIQFLSRYRIPLIIAVLLLTVAGTYYALQNRIPVNPQPIPLDPSSGSGPSSTTGGNSPMSALPTPGSSLISVKLSAGKAQPQPVEPLAVATGEPLSGEDVAGLLGRVPTLAPDPADQVDFRPAGDPIPPPRPGQTVADAFPPEPQDLTPAEAPASGPLEVLRHSPEGEISVAPFVSITFNQPMVPLTALEDLAARDVPVQIEPPLPGTWRWLGAKTLTFSYDSADIDRLPKATEYRVTVPAGTQSVSGGALAQDVSWTFVTPPPKLVSSYPPDMPQPTDPLFFLQFDQRVDPAAVLNTVSVTAGGRSTALRLVSEAEIQADEEHKELLTNVLAGRWVAFRAQEPLPADSAVQVSVGPGTPSAEGPLTTPAAQSYSFRTYAPLRIEEHGCSYGNQQCRPLEPLFIRFNNPIDDSAYDPAMLQISPELPGASVNVYGNTIQIQGVTQGQTTYTVVVSANLTDAFGQTLGRDQTLTFRVGPADPLLFNPHQLLVTVDPAATKPVFSVYSINYTSLEVDVYAVRAEDWPAYQQYLERYRRTDQNLTIPGRQVLDTTLRVEAPADKLTEVNVDLSPHMDGQFGHFIVIVRPPTGLFQNPQDAYWQTVQAWVQVTQIGVDAFADHSDLVVWASALKDGAPLDGVTVTAQPSGDSQTTGADGVARFAIPGGGATHLIARSGADSAVLPRTTYYWGDGWYRREIQDQLRWYVFDDRGMYRPGEEMHVKGWLRRVGGGQAGDVSLLGGEVSSVSYEIYDSQGNSLLNGDAEVNALGGFDFAVSLPEQVNLGYSSIQFTANGSISGVDNNRQFGHQFQIQEFRRPEFEVTARNETSGPYYAGESATLAVKAGYYAGGPLPDAEVNWQVESTPSHYAPPKWPEFTFGEWLPWWFFSEMDSFRGGPFGPGSETTYENFPGRTDGAGEHFLQLDFSTGEPRPLSVLASATVMDVNRQAWTGTTSLLVHPASLYVGMRSERYFVERGTPLDIEIIVTDLDGNPVTGRPVEVTAARLEWKYRDGKWQEEEVDAQVCSVASAAQPVTCTFQTPAGGSYRITALVTDDQGRLNRTRFTRWVSGGEVPPARNVEQEKLTLIPDKETYQPGDVAQILVQAPFSPAEGLLTIDRSGILETRRFSLDGGSATLSIPIEERHIPNLNIQVDVNGSAPRTDDEGNPLPDMPARPAFATATLKLQIPPLARTLAVEVAPAQPELEPGGETTLDLRVVDPAGQPVEGAELAVVVVDEAILALSGYQMADPTGVFYYERYLDVSSVYGRSTIVLANPLALGRDEAQSLNKSTATEMEESARAAGAGGAAPAAEAPAMPQATMAADMDAGADGFAGQAQADPIRIRTDFNPLAVFSPAVQTAGDGRAQVSVKLPDNLTRYRVMVAVVDAGGQQFGLGEANLTARLPLMVRPSAPRFLNFGDRFELPVVLQNQTDEPLTVDVAVRASNLALLDEAGAEGESAGRRVTVPPNDRLEVRFPAAARMAGTARLQFAAATGSFADAAEISLPVYTPATSEAFATYGVLDDGAVAQPLAAPSNVIPQYGGLEISTSSTAVQALTDAVLYLVDYPFDCTEQIASRVLAIAALRDVLTAFNAEGLPSPQELEASVGQDIAMLQTLQNDDGGFPYWRRGQESIPFNTIHAAHALARAEAKGFSVPADLRARALDYLRNIESHYPAWYDQHTRQTLSAYALYTRDLLGDRDSAKALRLLDQIGLEENSSLDAIGWLWPVIQDGGDAARLEAIRRHVNNRAVETAGAANFTTGYDEHEQNYLLLGSDRRTDAILLDALIRDNPQHDLIPKLVNGLLAHRTRGRWGSTQENVFVLLSLDRYFNTFEAQTPDFVARIWLGDTYAGSAEFRGRTTDRHETKVPMSYLLDPAQSPEQDLILAKEGGGRLYYRLGLRYAPADLQLDPLDMGFIVRRTYEAVDNPEDVSQDENGVWHIKAGARVRVRLTMVAENRRYHVALVDPLPAGLEIINPELDVYGGLPPDPQELEQKGWWWWGPWYQHQNQRDERAEAFTTLLWEGAYEYTYVARATTPGQFVVPPSKAEEMYSPEVFGRSASDTVIVE